MANTAGSGASGPDIEETNGWGGMKQVVLERMKSYLEASGCNFRFCSSHIGSWQEFVLWHNPRFDAVNLQSGDLYSTGTQKGKLGLTFRKVSGGLEILEVRFENEATASIPASHLLVLQDAATLIAPAGGAGVPQPLLILGAPGPMGEMINGIYKPAIDSLRGGPKYQKGNISIAQSMTSRQWKVCRNLEKYAFCEEKDVDNPTHAKNWVIGGERQASMVVTHDLSLASASVVEESAPKAQEQTVTDGKPIRIAGAMGEHAEKINGVYVPGSAPFNDHPQFEKDGIILRWSTNQEHWKVCDEGAFLNEGIYAFCTEKGLDDPTLAKSWMVGNEEQASMVVTYDLNLAPAGIEIQESEPEKLDNSSDDGMLLTDGDRTVTKSGGADLSSVYGKMQVCSGCHVWKVKINQSQPENMHIGIAQPGMITPGSASWEMSDYVGNALWFIKSPGNTGGNLDPQNERTFDLRPDDEVTIRLDFSLNQVTFSWRGGQPMGKPQGNVSGPVSLWLNFDYDDQSATLLEYSTANTSISFQLTGLEATQMCGASGFDRFNGDFEATGKLFGGRPEFHQRGSDGGRRIVWFNGRWQYFSTFDGPDNEVEECTFFVESEERFPPHAEIWYVHESKLNLCEGSKDAKLFLLFEPAIASGKPIRITGATGEHAQKINGVYTLTGELFNGLPLFQKREDDMWLYFYKNESATINCIWKVADGESFRAKDYACFAKSCEENLSSPTLVQQWRVDIGGNWEDQASVVAFHDPDETPSLAQFQSGLEDIQCPEVAETRSLNPEQGGVLTTASGAQVYVPPSEGAQDQTVTVTQVDSSTAPALPMGKGETAAPTLRFEAPELSGPVFVRLPHTSHSRNLQVWGENEGQWSALDSSQFTVGEKYADIMLEHCPRHLAASTGQGEEEAIVPLGFNAISSDSKTESSRIVIYLVPDNRMDLHAAVEEKMRKRQFAKVADGLEELLLRDGDDVIIESACSPELPKQRKWMGRPIAIECTISFSEVAGTLAPFSIRSLGSRQDAVEIVIPVERPQALPPKRPPAPLITSRAGGSTIFKIDESYNLSGCVVDIRYIRLNQKDTLKGSRSQGNIEFPSPEQIDEARWKILKQDPGTGGAATFHLDGVFAAYVQCQTRNQTGSSGWSDTLFFDNRQQQQVIAEGPSLASPDHEAYSAADPSSKFRAVAERAIAGSTGARMYKSLCSALSRHMVLVSRYADIANSDETQLLLQHMSACLNLITKCSAPGWLARLLEPPSPSWSRDFQEMHQSLTAATMDPNLRNLKSEAESGFQYIGARDSEEYMFPLKHLVSNIARHGGKIHDLQAQAAELALDFNTSKEEFLQELSEPTFAQAAERILAVSGPPAAVSGSPHKAASYLRTSPGHQNFTNTGPLIYLSGAIGDLGKRGDGFFDTLRTIILGGGDSAGLSIITSEELLAGDEEWDRRLPRMNDALRNCNIFVAVLTPSYHDVRYCQRELEEIWLLGKPGLCLLHQGVSGLASNLKLSTFPLLDLRQEGDDAEKELRLALAGQLGLDSWWAENGEHHPSQTQFETTHQVNDQLKSWLEKHRLGKHLEGLQDLGVMALEDLVDVDDEDLEQLAMTKIELRRFKRVLKACKEELETSSDVPATQVPIPPGQVNSCLPSQEDLEQSPHVPATQVPIPPGCKYHAFISHKQANAGDQVKSMFLELKQRGLSIWYDMDAEDLTNKGMAEGIRQSAVFILFLSAGVFERPFVIFEIENAIKFGKPIKLVHEEDDRHGKFEFSEFAQAPENVKRLGQDHESLPYRRRKHEADAFFHELVGRIRKDAEE